MSRRCTLTVSSLLMCVGLTAACGSLPAGTVRADHPTATAADTLRELRASYEALAAQLDVALCRFTAVAGSSSASMPALKLAATDMANSSSSVTNHLALLPWPGKLQADSQTLIRAIAAVETELRLAATRTTASATMKHIQAARLLIARIPLAGSPLRTDLHAADKSACY
jgi:hypothetical protein